MVIYRPSGPQSFGRLEVQLPCRHEGGNLHLNWRGQSSRIATSGTSQWHVSYTAWYHEARKTVEAITQGRRVVMVYNLHYFGGGLLPSMAKVADSRAVLDDALQQLKDNIEEDSETAKYQIHFLNNGSDKDQ